MDNKFAFLIQEYEKLKDEQTSRIAFRDQMIYITLVAIGGVFSFVLEKTEYSTALLVLPFVCIVLGWSYIVNDEKISAIGRYCRTVLIPKIESIKESGGFNLIPSWEEFHRSDALRKERKVIQFIIDISLFCVSGIFSIAVFFYLIGDNYKINHIMIAGVEGLCLVYLAYQFYLYSPWNEKRL
jgi:hypothetical protein